MSNEVFCKVCGKQLIPAPARFDGEATYVGYFPHDCQRAPQVNKEVQDWEYQAKALSAIKKGLEVSLKEYMEECERLAGLVDFWQKEYYKVNPGWQRPNIDNL